MVSLVNDCADIANIVSVQSTTTWTSCQCSQQQCWHHVSIVNKYVHKPIPCPYSHNYPEICTNLANILTKSKKFAKLFLIVYKGPRFVLPNLIGPRPVLAINPRVQPHALPISLLLQWICQDRAPKQPGDGIDDEEIGGQPPSLPKVSSILHGGSGSGGGQLHVDDEKLSPLLNRDPPPPWGAI